jgi:hypothetical protein
MRKIITLITFAICLHANSQITTSSKDSEVTQTSTYQDIHPYVDLGMRDTEGHPVYWAVYNIGVTITDYESLVYEDFKDGFSPENVGNHYSWGASDEDFFYYKSTEGDLVGQEDTATKMWGEGWRMPTLLEFKELNNRDEFEWTYRYNSMNSEKKYHGVSGYYITSKKEGFEGHQIFLPNIYFDGDTRPATTGYYWTSTCSPTDIEQAYHVGIKYFMPSTLVSINPQNRRLNAYVRAVFVDYCTTDIANIKEKDQSRNVLKTVFENRLIILKNGKKYSVDGKQL